MNKNIVGICGSPHGKSSNCFNLLTRALKATKVQTEIIVLSDNFDTPTIQKRLIEANGLIIATPTHWFNCSLLIKRLIDETFWDFSGEPYELEDMPVGIIAVCNEDGANQAISSIAIPLNHCWLFVPPFGTLIHNTRIPTHGESGWQDNPELVGEQVALYLKDIALQDTPAEKGEKG